MQFSRGMVIFARIIEIIIVMKHIFAVLFTIMLLVCAAVPARADFAVTSIKLSANDLDACAYFPVMDNYKRQCALIKVQVDPPQGGFYFETGSLGVEKVVEKLPEIWVYVPEKTMKIKIMHPKLGVISNSQEGDGYYWFHDKVGKLESGKVYVLKLALNKRIEENIVDVEEKTGYLTFNTEPEGAEVYLGPEGGELKYYDVTPFQLKLEYGTYNFRLKHMKYKDEMGRAVIDKDQVDLGLMKLTPDFGRINVTSEPSGAEVYLDGQNTGKRTPCVLDEVMSGKHSVRLNCAGYAPYSHEVEVTASVEPVKVNAVLDARFAPITINTLPNVEIKVDGEVRGTGTCTINLPMSVHDITASLAGYRTVTRHVNVTDNTPQTIDLMPTPIYGSLDVETKPIGATITINGVEYGKAPRTVRDLLVGEQTVTLNKDGYAAITRTVTIRENESALLKVDFNKDKSTQAPPPSPIVTPKPTTPEGNTNATRQLTIKWAKGMSSMQIKTIEKLFENMVYVKGGTFEMGATKEQEENAAADELPVHSVTLNDFMIGRYEVTQVEWRAVMGTTPSRWSGLQLPVENVSYWDCVAFVEKLNVLTGVNFRLPTEAEWEYAARGGQNIDAKKKKQDKYSGANGADKVGWYNNNGNYATKEVGKKKENKLGLYDMSGNVCEWCSDKYAPYTSEAQINPKVTAATPDYVVRGGHCQAEAGDCRVSNRDYQNPDVKKPTTGLRLVLDLTK